MERIRERKAEDIIKEFEEEGYLDNYKLIRKTEHFAVIVYWTTETRLGRLHIINGSDRTIDLYIDYDWKTREVKEADMSWASLGTATTEDAFKFAALIKEAAELVQDLNKEETKKEINDIIK